MTVKPRYPQPSHTPAYRYGTLVNQACEESRRIITDAKAGKRLAGTPCAQEDRHG